MTTRHLVTPAINNFTNAYRRWGLRADVWRCDDILQRLAPTSTVVNAPCYSLSYKTNEDDNYIVCCRLDGRQKYCGLHSFAQEQILEQAIF
ncbi:Hypothetical predicted protein [Octopus vulgaris]|uniref:Uncharacterized protein n=1 Tax=Octopus vulgaris TaxID=6645 RepID=A0AA36BDB0_OCTVU|nr:Hypothetical predicted protein [Octopus vulgaris]